MPRAAKPQISFADWELLQQGIVLEPLLQSISDFLDDHEEMIEAVRCDLERGLKHPGTGRSGLTPQQVLRSLVLMRVKNWNYREVRERITDGYTLRQFTDFYCQPVPKHDAFNRAFNRLTPQTLQAVNELVVQAAVDRGLEEGQKLRVDSTVPTDRHSSSDRQHVVRGCRTRDHALNRLPRRGRSAAYSRVLQSHAGGAASDARNPADDGQGTARATNREISPTHRNNRRGREQRTKSIAADRESARQESDRRPGHW